MALLRRRPATGAYGSGGTTRARDLVDLLLVREHERLDLGSLGASIRQVFARRGAIPETLPVPARELAVGYRTEAERVGVVSRIEEAHRLLAAWLDPVLASITKSEPGSSD